MQRRNRWKSKFALDAPQERVLASLEAIMLRIENLLEAETPPGEPRETALRVFEHGFWAAERAIALRKWAIGKTSEGAK